MCRLKEYTLAGRLLLAVWLLFVCPLTCGSTSQPKCYGEFDVYFTLDQSSSVPAHNFKKETVNFVENILKGFKSFKSGTSFITFSDKDKENVVMELTRDRNKIAQGIEDLRKVKPNGMTYLSGALKKANEQIIRLGERRASIIIIVTDGRLYDLDDSVAQANKARSLGASVVTVGVGAYKMSQLKELASKPHEQFIFTSKNFDSLPDLISKIVEKSCIEILSASPTEICTGVPYNVTILGDGFTKTDDINKVICSYSFNATYRTVQKPVIVEDTRLVCQGFLVNESDRNIVLQMSVNKGLTFVSSNVTITSQSCAVPDKTTPPADERVKESPTNVGLAVFLVLLFLFLFAFLLWWFKPILCKARPKPAKYKPAPPKPPPPKPPPPESKTGSGKTKWPTVDASYYGGGGVGGIAPVRVDWGDKGSTEAGSKLAKAKGATSKDAEDLEKLTGKGSGRGGGGRGAAGGSPGCLAGAKATIVQGMAGCVAAMSRGYQRLSSYRPRPGGNPLYSSPDAHA